MNEENESEEEYVSLLDEIHEAKAEREWKLFILSIIMLIIIVGFMLAVKETDLMYLNLHLTLSVSIVYWYLFLSSRIMFSKIQQVLYLGSAFGMSIFAIIIAIPHLSGDLPLYYWISSLIPVLSILIFLLGISDIYGGKLIYWGFVVLDILCVGIVLILLGFEISFPEMAIEMAGAFIGLGGAIALGELLKAHQFRGDSKKLFHALLEELDDIKKELEIQKILNTDQRDDIPYQIWHAALYSNEILNFDSVERKKMTNAYYMISKYNEANTDTRIESAIDTIWKLTKKEDIDPELIESDETDTENEHN